MKKSKVRIGYLIALLVVIIGVGGYLVYEKTDMFREFPEYERKLEGDDPSPKHPWTKFTIEYNGSHYSNQSMRIETLGPISNDQATEIENSVGGIICGGHHHTRQKGDRQEDYNIYYLCFSPIPRNGEELWDATFKAGKFDFVKSATPSRESTPLKEA